MVEIAILLQKEVEILKKWSQTKLLWNIYKDACSPDKLSIHLDYVLFHGTFSPHVFVIKCLVLFFIDIVCSLFSSARESRTPDAGTQLDLLNVLQQNWPLKFHAQRKEGDRVSGFHQGRLIWLEIWHRNAGGDPQSNQSAAVIPLLWQSCHCREMLNCSQPWLVEALLSP